MPLRAADGRITGTFGISRDITRRKQTEEELRHTQQFLASIVEHIPNMIFVKDAQNLRFVRFNRAGEDLLGYSRDELLGKNDYDFFPKEEADFFTAKDREVLGNGRVEDIPEEPIKTRFKGERVLHTIKIPLLDDQGEPQFLLGISEDVTDRMRAEEAQRQAEAKERDVMERTDRLNSIGLLAAGMAHEINNPLQGMMSHMSLIKKALPVGSPGRKNADLVLEGIESISALVHRLLSLGTEEHEFTESTGDGRQALEFVAQLVESQLSRARIKLEVRIAPGPLRVAMAEKALVQVLLNLIINARDAMPDGGTMTLEAFAVSPWICLTVRDTGVGIAKEAMGKLFTPFYTTKGGAGVGLGLSVAASLVRSFGGEVEVESEWGRGSCFTVRVPIIEKGPA
jgi:PAS domain S-box-containing protein